MVAKMTETKGTVVAFTDAEARKKGTCSGAVNA